MVCGVKNYVGMTVVLMLSGIVRQDCVNMAEIVYIFTVPSTFLYKTL